MAKKRGRTVSIDRMMKQVSQLDATRAVLIKQIRQTFDASLRAIGDTVHMAGEGTGFAAGVRGPGRPAKARKRRKMSAKARKAISDAQKKRWAAQRAGKK